MIHERGRRGERDRYRQDPGGPRGTGAARGAGPRARCTGGSGADAPGGGAGGGRRREAD